MKVCIIFFLMISVIAACATGGKKTSAPHSKKGDYSAKPSRKGSPDNRKEISVSGNLRAHVNSLSNSPQSSKVVDKAKARALANRLERQVKAAKKIDASDVLALISAKRLAGESTRDVISAAKRLVVQEMRKDINRKLPEIGQIELATAAFQSKQFGLAEYYIIQLVDSKSPQIKSAALNLSGLMEYRFSTIRNATSLWEEALKADSSNQAARLNLALVALIHADFKNATRLLQATEQDWFVQGNLAVAAKLSMNAKRAQNLCDEALKKQARNRALLFNCAVADFQVAGDFGAALSKLQRANSMSGGGANLSEKIVSAIRTVKAKQGRSAEAGKSSDKKKR